MLGDNLPPPAEVVALFQQHNITRMRIYFPTTEILEDLRLLASDAATAGDWIDRNVRAHWPNVLFRRLVVGNELIPSVAEAQFILPAMKNLHNALSSAGLENHIKVSTAVDTGVLGQSYPPSAGKFTAAAGDLLGPIVEFLSSTGAPLLANVYTYFAYVGNPADVSLDYALFTAGGAVVSDGELVPEPVPRCSGFRIRGAGEDRRGRLGGRGLGEWVAVGWQRRRYRRQRPDLQPEPHPPHAEGTPRKPGRPIETYIFAMFNENKKAPGTEENFGLFYPNKQPVYPINFQTQSI
ncbi:unnamed protein product [Spirodela intermedia]|uniref:Uncharacterized protein n=1 Tax=Spirodela intermedia TaxID=51605 RepID=A0A7I8IWS9_SPIIN|nr:unnamed protein product [Spirodela intermedia]CAA6662144.1 unnamed protein product [Spirodela intermedia]